MPFINMEKLRKVQDALMAANSALAGQGDIAKASIDLIAAQCICTTAFDEMADPAVRDAAFDRYATDEIEIDDEAATAQADGGTWVAAWVWIEQPDCVHHFKEDEYGINVCTKCDLEEGC